MMKSCHVPMNIHEQGHTYDTSKQLATRGDRAKPFSYLGRVMNRNFQPLTKIPGAAKFRLSASLVSLLEVRDKQGTTRYSHHHHLLDDATPLGVRARCDDSDELKLRTPVPETFVNGCGVACLAQHKLV